MNKKVLELFAWSRSVWKVCDELWIETFSTDLYDFEKINLKKNIMQISPCDIPFIPDIIWASPPCTAFSVLRIWHNWVKWEEFTPKTDWAILWIYILNKTIDLIEQYRKINPNLIFYIENPRGKMRKSPRLKNYIRHTVSYCQYWFDVMKPTDIWTNNSKWKPKPICRRWSPCHISSPRWSSWGIQWKRNSFIKSKIPYQLCKEIILSSNT